MSDFPDLSHVSFPENLVGKWEKISLLKGEVSKALELRRREKKIGHSLDALVRLELPKDLKAILEPEQDQLKFIFIVSGVEVVETLKGEAEVYVGESIEGVKISVHPAPGTKCERCWNYFVDEPAPGHPSICLRCVKNLESAEA